VFPRRSWAVGSAAIHNSTGSRFHGCSAIALICTDGAGAVDRACNPKGTGLTLQLAKDRILVSEKVTDKTVAVTLVHREAALNAWPKDARRQCLGECRNVILVSRREVYQSCKMGHNSVKRSDVIEAELAKCALQDLDPAFFRRLMSGSRINGLNDFVNLRRNKGVYERQLASTPECPFLRLHEPGNSRRYNFNTLATIGTSYFSNTS
jgi:hypothetical protein